MKKILTAFTLSLLISTVAEAATYYVATNGSDSNPGTISSPFRTVKKGTDILVAGDTLYIRGGNYGETIYYDSDSKPVIASGTSWSNPIIIFAYPGEQVTLKGAGLYNVNVHYV